VVVESPGKVREIHSLKRGVTGSKLYSLVHCFSLLFSGNVRLFFCQVDGAYAVVRCGKDGSDVLAAGKDDPTSLLSDCRILRKDDLQVVRGNTAPRVPDCFQRTPKKIMLPEMGQILATAVDTQGISVFFL